MTTTSKRMIALILASAIAATSIAAPVMAQSNANNQPATMEKVEKHEKSEKSERAEKVEKNEKDEQAEKAQNLANNPNLVKSLEDQGYIVHDLEQEHGRWQAEVTEKNGKNGKKFELTLDEQGKILSQEADE